jgi:hypothetical protein
MVVEIKEYKSANEIVKMLDHELTQTKTMLGEYLRRLDEIRSLAERSKKVRDAVSKLAGKKAVQNASGDIVLGDLNVVVDASPLQELAAIEEAVRSQQDRLLVLQKVREDMKWADQFGDTEGLEFMVLESNGVPTRILLKIS